MKFINTQLLKVITVLALTLIVNKAVVAQGFKVSQQKYTKVKTAYSEKWAELSKELKAKKITSNFDILLRAFKYEKKLEVWLKNKTDKSYLLFKTYDICATSGELGPKRKEGDGQIPEGFYLIDLFNPTSDYYLSLRVNYPNASDRVLSDKRSPGGAIMIHGNCVTIGCIPITDENIKELYVLAVEVKNNNGSIPVDIYPCYLNQENLKMLEKLNQPQDLAFWRNLKEGYDYFETHKFSPKIKTDKSGKYIFEERK